MGKQEQEVIWTGIDQEMLTVEKSHPLLHSIVRILPIVGGITISVLSQIAGGYNLVEGFKELPANSLRYIVGTVFLAVGNIGYYLSVREVERRS